ncbi:PREDICTED: uncharacterized protein LOC102014969 [Chinchilla lanigera]|uniref:uncharacterized protein LOC102014969 n=1 Tax=Chinchilla lanigera TaxID=34839 RepID=UPI000697765E|nr:PREDICTED: uncharacterized protein LOC102014969 [Chinchilla lanigera]
MSGEEALPRPQLGAWLRAPRSLHPGGEASARFCAHPWVSWSREVTVLPTLRQRASESHPARDRAAPPSSGAGQLIRAGRQRRRRRPAPGPAQWPAGPGPFGAGRKKRQKRERGREVSETRVLSVFRGRGAQSWLLAGPVFCAAPAYQARRGCKPFEVHQQGEVLLDFRSPRFIPRRVRVRPGGLPPSLPRVSLPDTWPLRLSPLGWTHTLHLATELHPALSPAIAQYRVAPLSWRQPSLRAGGSCRVEDLTSQSHSGGQVTLEPGLARWPVPGGTPWSWGELRILLICGEFPLWRQRPSRYLKVALPELESLGKQKFLENDLPGPAPSSCYLQSRVQFFGRVVRWPLGLREEAEEICEGARKRLDRMGLRWRQADLEGQGAQEQGASAGTERPWGTRSEHEETQPHPTVMLLKASSAVPGHFAVLGLGPEGRDASSALPCFSAAPKAAPGLEPSLASLGHPLSGKVL